MSPNMLQGLMLSFGLVVVLAGAIVLEHWRFEELRKDYRRVVEGLARREGVMVEREFERVKTDDFELKIPPPLWGKDN